MSIAKERTTHYLTVDFLDRDGAAALPQSVVYRIDCRTTSTAIRPETNVTPAASLEIVLNADDMRIVDPKNATERRVVTVRATYGENDQVQDEFAIDIKNLEFA